MEHTIEELRQKQHLPLDVKILMSRQRIRQWYEHWNGNVFVSFSGGKDSTVLKHLVETELNGKNIPSVFVNTGLEYPEIQKFVREQLHTVIVYPKLRFDEVVTHYGYPVISKEVAMAGYSLQQAKITGKLCKSVERRVSGDKATTRYSLKKWKHLADVDFRVSAECCKKLKKEPSKEYEKLTGRKPILGSMAEESQLRTRSWLKTGCNAYDNKRPSSKPLSFWTEQDVLQYLKRFNIPYCPIYGEIKERDDGTLYTTGVQRTGCMFCMFGCHLEKSPNRFQQLAKTHPRQYTYCIGGGVCQ